MFTKRWLIDAVERVVVTFAQAFLAIIVAAPMLDMSTMKAAAVAGIGFPELCAGLVERALARPRRVVPVAPAMP